MNFQLNDDQQAIQRTAREFLADAFRPEEVRLIGDVGYRSVSWIYPSLRLSYQARDIDHAGVSGGLAMNFDW